MSDIKSREDVHSWKREQIEDVLHSNFVSFDKSASLEGLTGKLQLLWMRGQRVASKDNYIITTLGLVLREFIIEA